MCSRVDGTPLRRLPHLLDKLRKLQDLCARLAVGPLPVRYAAGCSFVDHCKLEELPDSICELSLTSLCAPPYCRAPFCAWPALTKASTAAEPHVRCSDVSHNELRALPGCLDTTNLTTMCAPRTFRPDCVAHGA